MTTFNLPPGGRFFISPLYIDPFYSSAGGDKLTCSAHNMKAAIYARISSDETKKGGVSIDSQLRGCRKVCVEKGYSIVEPPFIDDDWPGERPDRPEMIKLLVVAERHEIDVVVCLHSDRLGRGDALTALTSEFKKLNVPIEFALQPDFFSGDDTTTYINTRLYSLFSGIEKRRIVERTTRAKREKAMQGHVIMSHFVSYGYRALTKRDDGRSDYQRIEEELKWVKQIFEWALKGESSRAIAKKLTAAKAPRQRESKSVFKQNKEWSKSTVLKILNKTIYYGVIYWNRTMAVLPKNPPKDNKLKKRLKSATVLKPRKEWIEISRPDLAVITKEMFDKVHQQLEKNKVHSARNTHNFYLLRGMVFCGECGCQFYSENYHGKRFYRDSNRSRREPLPRSCDMGSRSADVLEGLVVENFKKNFVDESVILKKWSEMFKEDRKKFEESFQEEEEVNKKIAATEDKLKKLIDLLTDNRIMRGHYDEYYQKYNEELQNLRNRKEQLKSNDHPDLSYYGFIAHDSVLPGQSLSPGVDPASINAAHPAYTFDISLYKKSFKELRKKIMSMSFEEFRNLFITVNLKVTVFKDRLEVVGKFPWTLEDHQVLRLPGQQIMPTGGGNN